MQLFCIQLFLLLFIRCGKCWTTEDLELFDLVENTPQNFYDLLGVDQKASASDIRKAYRKLSTLYHPDKNKEPDAEETFRRIAAVADVLRNDERRKSYDLILKTGLPDWRAPIYYYRRVRNMGLLELTIFLFVLATLAQYLFAWSAYWERKYEIEEIVLSKIRKKAKHQRKGKNAAKIDEDATVTEVISNLQKPRCQDLFPVRLCFFFVYIIKSLPSFLVYCRNYFEQRKINVEETEEEEEEIQEVRMKCKKQSKPKVPDYSSIESYDISDAAPTIESDAHWEQTKQVKKKWAFNSLTENQMQELKKALKKFPNGTLQRWEKVAAYLDCSVPEVVSMVKEMKSQSFSKNVPLSVQGVTGTEKENFGFELYEEKGLKHSEIHLARSSTSPIPNGETVEASKTVTSKPEATNLVPEKIWKQEEQRSLEIALQKYPKDTPARWDKIAAFVSSKTKEECIERYKILAQQVKKKKDKNV